MRSHSEVPGGHRFNPLPVLDECREEMKGGNGGQCLQCETLAGMAREGSSEEVSA